VLLSAKAPGVRRGSGSCWVCTANTVQATKAAVQHRSNGTGFRLILMHPIVRGAPAGNRGVGVAPRGVRGPL
jgi:hypothetical protein